MYPNHVRNACKAGADIIRAQGGEAAGHTGDMPTNLLNSGLRRCLQAASNWDGGETRRRSGDYDGRSLASGAYVRY
jgi:NAD(P)H-dependent flavin oxidoreductase YrpB (nitropropane dioxygenase family)